MAKNDFQYGGCNFYTLKSCMIMTLISPGDCTLQCGMWLWNCDSEFTKWVAAPCNVIHGSGMTCHWICPVAAPCNVPHSYGIVTSNLPGGSTLRCGKWLWDDMPLNLRKRLPYWNFTSGFDFDHITAVDMLFCTSLGYFIQIGPRSAEKNDVMSIFKIADLSHLGF